MARALWPFFFQTDSDVMMTCKIGVFGRHKNYYIYITCHISESLRTLLLLLSSSSLLFFSLPSILVFHITVHVPVLNLITLYCLILTEIKAT